MYWMQAKDIPKYEAPYQKVGNFRWTSPPLTWTLPLVHPQLLVRFEIVSLAFALIPLGGPAQGLIAP
jgi:hypothetical protein